MDLKTLKTFQMIANCGSFVRVAEELNYAQSTITMQIQKLESELGIPLFERGKKIRLTEAGRMFHEQIVPIMQQMEQLQSNLSDFQVGEAGHIRLGVTEPTASYRLPAILDKFLSRYPKIRISVDIGNTPALSERLIKGDIDLALCSAPELGSDLYFEPLFKEEFVVLIPDKHPLAQKSVLTPGDLRNHRLLITSTTCPYRKKLEMVLQEYGSPSIDTMEIGSMTALKHYVERGLGVALVPKIVTDPIPTGTIVRTITGSLIDMTFGILCKPSEYPFRKVISNMHQTLQEELCEISVQY